jgi:acyl-coenzyme A thioesterase PaaI-like protein
MAGSAEALFVPDGDHLLPTGYARGPWSEHSLHGGPVAALVVRALERVDAPAVVRLARVTVELLRPVPLAPLVVSTEVVRPGVKVSTVDARVSTADGQLLVMARAQRIRVAEVEFPDGSDDSPPDLPDSASDTSAWPGADRLAFHSHATEHRFVVGRFGGIGPSTDWVRLRVPVVLGEEPTGWQRAAAIADFSNGISAVVPFDGTSLFINPRGPRFEYQGKQFFDPDGDQHRDDLAVRHPGVDGRGGHHVDEAVAAPSASATRSWSRRRSTSVAAARPAA